MNLEAWGDDGVTGPPSQMPAITVWQPWASLIAEGFKPFEFRRWPAPAKFVGRRIAIHAGVRPIKPREVRDLLAQMRAKHPNPALDVACIPLLERALAAPGDFPTRAVVCTAVLGEPISPSGIRARFANDSDRDEEFHWGWPMLDVRRLEPPRSRHRRARLLDLARAFGGRRMTMHSLSTARLSDLDPETEILLLLPGHDVVNNMVAASGIRTTLQQLGEALAPFVRDAAITVQIGRIDPRPGEILVLHSARPVSVSQAAAIQEHLGHLLPGHPFVVLQPGLHLYGLRPDENGLRALAEQLRPFLKEEPSGEATGE